MSSAAGRLVHPDSVAPVTSMLNPSAGLSLKNVANAIDPLEWTFYVASPKRIDETYDDQKTIGVVSALNRVGAVTTSARGLRAVVADVLQC